MKKLLSLLARALVVPFGLVLAQEEAPAVDAVKAGPTSIADYTTGIPTMVYYYIAGLLVFFIVYFLVMKAVKKKGDTFKSNQFAAIDQKSASEKQALLDYLFEKDGILHVFQEAVKGEHMIGLRQCFPYKTLWSAAKDTAKTLGKQALWSVVGVKATYVDVGRYYLVLTNTHLHYLTFDKHSELAVNEAFPLSQLMNITLRKAGTKDAMKNAEAVGQEVLEFEFNGEKISFTYYIQNVDFPNVEYKEYTKALTDHYDAFLYVEMMFKKKLEEKAGGVQE